MSEPNFSTLYDVTIRKYKSVNRDSQDTEEVQVLASSLREANELAEDYAEAIGQDGPYQFYDIVSITEFGTVFTGMTKDAVKDTEGAGVESGGAAQQDQSNSPRTATGYGGLCNEAVNAVQFPGWNWSFRTPFYDVYYPSYPWSPVVGDIPKDIPENGTSVSHWGIQQ